MRQSKNHNLTLREYKIFTAIGDLFSGESAASIVNSLLPSWGFEGASVDVGYGLWRGVSEKRITTSLVAWTATEHLVLELAQAITAAFNQETSLILITDVHDALSIRQNGRTDDALDLPHYLGDRREAEVREKYDSPSAAYKPAHGGYPES